MAECHRIHARANSPLDKTRVLRGRETFTAGTYDQRLDALRDFTAGLAGQAANPALVALGVTVNTLHPMKTFIHKLRASVLAGLLSITGAALAQVPDTLIHNIPAPLVGVQTSAVLGSSVAVDGGYTVAGAPYDDIGGEDSGVVKVFNSTTGALVFVIPNPSPATNDQFGFSVAISGTRVVVGTQNDDTGATDAGSAYVYDLSSVTPTVPVATLNNPGPTAGDYFGWSVAISGTRVLVGAASDDTGASGSGSVYVYDLSSGTPTMPVATLNNPSPAAGDAFGSSVAISGTQALVGAYSDDAGATDAGSAYVYDLSSGTPTVPVATLNNPGPASGDFFGWSVAISSMYVVVGAYSDDAGATNVGRAYVYETSSGTPTVPLATLDNPTPVAFDNFAHSVAISGMRVVVGAYADDIGASDAGSAYVYDLGGVTPTVPIATLNNPTPASGDQFGFSVAISGTRVVAGARTDDTGATDAGSVYVYDLGSGTPTVPSATLNSPGIAAGDRFGYSVAISGTLVVAGAPSDDTGAIDAGRAYVYDLASGTPTVPVATLNNPSPATTDIFGISVAISGSRVVVGAYQDDTGATNAGSAYVYDLSRGTPTVPMATLNKPGPAASDFFGWSVAIFGTRVVVGVPRDDTGASGAGSVYVYDLNSGTPTLPVVTLNNPSPAVDDQFGASVAISGARVVVGAFLDDTGASGAGIAYVYDLSSGTPTVPVVTLNNPSPASGDSFGESVAIDGTRVVVGAYWDDTGATNSGIAYVYELSSGTPTVPAVTLNNPSPAADDLFGSSVAISGTRVVVAAYRDDTGATDAGIAYVYELSSGTPTVPVATLNNPSPAASDNFGWSAAIDGSTIAIGTPFDDSVMFDKGSAYIFGPSNPDFDGDGLLDLWEHARFGSIATASAGSDTDGDGLNELFELAFNTNPLAIDSPSALPQVLREGDFLTISLSKRAGVLYTVETASSPSSADFSIGTTTTLTNTAGTLKVRDNFTPATAAQRFMRVKVTAAP